MVRFIFPTKIQALGLISTVIDSSHPLFTTSKVDTVILFTDEELYS